MTPYFLEICFKFDTWGGVEKVKKKRNKMDANSHRSKEKKNINSLN